MDTPQPLRRDISAVRMFKTLLSAQLKQLLRARKTLALFLIQLVPVAAVLVYVFVENVDGLVLLQETVEDVTFPLLVPLAALFYGGPAVVDEIEGRTLTYLTLRPVPKPWLYAGKLVAGWIVGGAVVLIPMALLFIVSLTTSSDLMATAGAMARLSASAALGVIVYSSIFALLGAIFATSLISGVLYFVIFEVILAALPVLELLSVRYHLRTLAGFNASDRLGRLDKLVLDEAIVLPVWVGVLILLLIGLSALGAGAMTFQNREYRV